ncbi:MAG: hypothetical protein LBH20_01830 [Treponema sp.]|jgi:hypothetical protein|nr:hypothetical protein [Treponema sp.]
MTVTQTVVIPASHRLVIDVPREVPEGRSVISFKPATEADFEECPICAAHRDPETGELRFKPEIMAGMQEVEDMLSGKIPVKWHTSIDDLDKMLGL